VDLLYTWGSETDDDGEPSGTLCTGTLAQSLHGVLLRIEEAQEAADKLPYVVWS
jgi:hypothetical protein